MIFDSVYNGPPLAIDWDYISEEMVDLELFEELRAYKRRVSTQFKIPAMIRHQTLVDLGFSLKEIREATKQATIARRSRLRTIEMLHTSNFQESVEKVLRKFSKPFRRSDETNNLKPTSTKKKQNKRRLSGFEKYALNMKSSSSNDSESEILSSGDENEVKTSHMDTTQRTKHYDLAITSAKSEEKQIVVDESRSNPDELNVPDINSDSTKTDLTFTSSSAEDISTITDNQIEEYGTKSNDQSSYEDKDDGLMTSYLCLPTIGIFLRNVRLRAMESDCWGSNSS